MKAGRNWRFESMIYPDELEQQLGRPLPAAARLLQGEALAEKQKLVAERLKTTLPEGSEPCVMFHATPYPPNTR